MARKIADQEEAAAGENQPKGAVFVKNQVNELIVFDDGSTYKFQSSREVIQDEELANKLRSVASKHGIFESQ